MTSTVPDAAVYFRLSVPVLRPFQFVLLYQLDKLEVSNGNNSGQNVPYVGFN